MKKIIIITNLVAAIMFGAIESQAQAFTSSKQTSVIDKEVIADAVKETTITNTRVLNAFAKDFKNVTPEWTTYDDKFIARFKDNNNSVQVLYNKKGKMIYSITHGTETLLSASQKSVITANYPCYSLGVVTKAESLGQTVWVTNIEKDNNLVILTIINDEIAEAKAYKSSF